MKDEKLNLCDHTHDNGPDDIGLRSTREHRPVGYGNPPRQTRWKAGQSGNPAGRPKGSLSRKTIQIALADIYHNSFVTLKERGGRVERKVSKLNAILIDTANRAVTGDHRDKKFALELYEKYLEDEAPGTTEENADEDEAILRRHGLNSAVRENTIEPEADEDDGQNDEGDQ